MARAVDTATGHGFATSKPVTMFDAKTFAVLKKIDVQGNPDGYLNDAYNHHFYVLSHSEPNITVLDDKDGSILGTINIGGAPEQAATDSNGKIYVDIVDKAAVAVIDANTMKMTAKYDVSSKGGGCAGLRSGRARTVSSSPPAAKRRTWTAFPATDGHIITDLPIGDGSDGATFNPATMEAFSSQGDGTLTVVKENSPTDFSVEQTVPTLPRAKVLTLDTEDQSNSDYHGGIWPGTCRPSCTSSSSRSACGRTGLGASTVDARPSGTHDPTFFSDHCDREVILPWRKRKARRAAGLSSFGAVPCLDRIHIQQELSIVPRLLQLADQQLHRLNRRQRMQHLAQHPGAGKVVLGDEQFFLTRARARASGRREDALIDQLAIQNHFHIARTLEFFEDDLVHARTGIDEGGRNDG